MVKILFLGNIFDVAGGYEVTACHGTVVHLPVPNSNQVITVVMGPKEMASTKAEFEEAAKAPLANEANQDEFGDLPPVNDYMENESHHPVVTVSPPTAVVYGTVNDDMENESHHPVVTVSPPTAVVYGTVNDDMENEESSLHLATPPLTGYGMAHVFKRLNHLDGFPWIVSPQQLDKSPELSFSETSSVDVALEGYRDLSWSENEVLRPDSSSDSSVEFEPVLDVSILQSDSIVVSNGGGSNTEFFTPAASPTNAPVVAHGSSNRPSMTPNSDSSFSMNLTDYAATRSCVSSDLDLGMPTQLFRFSSRRASPISPRTADKRCISPQWSTGYSPIRKTGKVFSPPSSGPNSPLLSSTRIEDSRPINSLQVSEAHESGSNSSIGCSLEVPRALVPPPTPSFFNWPAMPNSPPTSPLTIRAIANINSRRALGLIGRAISNINISRGSLTDHLSVLDDIICEKIDQQSSIDDVRPLGTLRNRLKRLISNIRRGKDVTMEYVKELFDKVESTF